ncbi:hypothetical protein BaRGS_00015571 [Batillaria attramentaria]|uniref:Uncharacterized protein n=1 Tax=Batillaria attramentaria TaxID=370345 RepID=A0ABD0L1E9_9CAEN
MYLCTREVWSSVFMVAACSQFRLSMAHYKLTFKEMGQPTRSLITMSASLLKAARRNYDPFISIPHLLLFFRLSIPRLQLELLSLNSFSPDSIDFRTELNACTGRFTDFQRRSSASALA